MLDFIRQNAQIFAQNGSVVATYRNRGTKRYGPYYRVAYRVDGRQCSTSADAEGSLSACADSSPASSNPATTAASAVGQTANERPLCARSSAGGNTRSAPTASTFAAAKSAAGTPAASPASTRPPHTPRPSTPPQPSSACRLQSRFRHPPSSIRDIGKTTHLLTNKTQANNRRSKHLQPPGASRHNTEKPRHSCPNRHENLRVAWGYLRC